MLDHSILVWEYDQTNSLKPDFQWGWFSPAIALTFCFVLPNSLKPYFTRSWAVISYWTIPRKLPLEFDHLFLLKLTILPYNATICQYLHVTQKLSCPPHTPSHSFVSCFSSKSIENQVVQTRCERLLLTHRETLPLATARYPHITGACVQHDLWSHGTEDIVAKPCQNEYSGARIWCLPRPLSPLRLLSQCCGARRYW